jgi:hypothetical protein
VPDVAAPARHVPDWHAMLAIGLEAMDETATLARIEARTGRRWRRPRGSSLPNALVTANAHLPNSAGDQRERRLAAIKYSFRGNLGRLLVIVFSLQVFVGCDPYIPMTRDKCDIFKADASPITGIMVEPAYGARYFIPDSGGFCRVDLSIVKPEKIRVIPNDSDCFAVISRSEIMGYRKNDENIVTHINSSRVPTSDDIMKSKIILQNKLKDFTLCASDRNFGDSVLK